MADADLHELEQSPKSGEIKDPYDFRNGVKSEADLAAMRKRKQGKGLEMYYRRQNNVCCYCSHVPAQVLTPRSS